MKHYLDGDIYIRKIYSMAIYSRTVGNSFRLNRVIYGHNKWVDEVIHDGNRFYDDDTSVIAWSDDVEELIEIAALKVLEY